MFSGLTNRQLMELAIVALKNVDQYKKDVKLLIDNNSYGRAVSLSILGIEEFAKGMNLYACSSDYFTLDEKKKLLLQRGKKSLSSHQWKLDLALDHALEIALLRWFTKEILESGITLNSDSNSIQKELVERMIEIRNNPTILTDDNSEEAKLLIETSSARISKDFQPSLLDKRKQQGFYVEPQSDPLEITKEEAEKYYQHLTILNKFGTLAIVTIMSLLEYPALYDNFQRHLSRESGERVMKALKKEKKNKSVLR